MKKIKLKIDEEKIGRLLRVSKNIDVAVRFLGEKSDKFNALVNELDKKTTNDDIIEEVVSLDVLSEDLTELYELLNNLSEELNEIVDNIKLETIPF